MFLSQQNHNGQNSTKPKTVKQTICILECSACEIKAIVQKRKDGNFFRWVSTSEWVQVNYIQFGYVWRAAKPISVDSKCMLMRLNHSRCSRNYTVPFPLAESCVIMLCKRDNTSSVPYPFQPTVLHGVLLVMVIPPFSCKCFKYLTRYKVILKLIFWIFSLFRFDVSSRFIANELGEHCCM